MKTLFVEKGGSNQRVYNSILVDPKSLSVFNNELSIKIITEIAKEPQCAMDVAKKLKIHEQKVYYYLRKFKEAGIVTMTSEESRYGMTAKIFSLVSPVLATKLYDNGYELKEESIDTKNPEIQEFLKPFIVDGKLNAKIIIGDPYPHGPYDTGSLDGCYVADLALFLGHFLRGTAFPCHKLDIRISDDDMKNNLIVIGNPKGNLITHKLNKFLPIYFDGDDDWTIVSKISGKSYKDDLSGVIVKDANPFNKKKWVLVLAGMRTRGTLASVIAFTKHIDDIVKNTEDGKIYKVVHGVDKDGDGIVDSVKFLE